MTQGCDLGLLDAVEPLRAGGVAVVGQVGVESWSMGGHCNQDRDTEQPLTQPRPRVGQVVGVSLGPHVEVIAVVSPLRDTHLVSHHIVSYY